MSADACELRPMFSFNPSEPAILHDRITDDIEPGQERKKPTTEKIPSRYLMGLRVRRMGQRAGRLTKRGIVLFFRNFAP